MSLFQSPPDVLEIDGKEYPIDTDFRLWVRFQGVLLADDSDDEKVEKVFHMMDEIGLPKSKEAFDAMTSFYVGATSENSTESGKNVRSFDFEQDSEYIFSAFLECYGIDLSTEKIHWWKFKALFKSLPEDCQICKIMGYRSIDLKKVPKDQKQFYRDMKLRYSLNSGYKSEYKTEQEMKEYVKKRFAEAQSRMSEMRGHERASLDSSES